MSANVGRFLEKCEDYLKKKLALILTTKLCTSLICNEGCLFFKNCPTLYTKRHIYLLNKYNYPFLQTKEICKYWCFSTINKKANHKNWIAIPHRHAQRCDSKPWLNPIGKSPPAPLTTVWIPKRQMCALDSTFWFHLDDVFDARQSLVLHKNQRWRAKRRAVFQSQLRSISWDSISLGIAKEKKKQEAR